MRMFAGSWIALCAAACVSLTLAAGCEDNPEDDDYLKKDAAASGIDAGTDAGFVPGTPDAGDASADDSGSEDSGSEDAG